MRNIVVVALLAAVLPATAEVQWEFLESQVDPFTDVSISGAYLLSEERRLSLNYSCRSDGEDALRLLLGSRLDAFENGVAGGRIRFRFDDLPVRRVTWVNRNDFLDAISLDNFLGFMRRHDTLLMEALSVRNGPVTDRFDLAGPAAMLEQINCGGG